MEASRLTARYHLSGARGAQATATVTDEGVVVHEGARASLETVPSIHAYLTRIRERLIAQEALVERDGVLVFTRDHLFSSPSTAAGVILGRSANGRVEWKDEAGRTLKEVEEAEGVMP